jgi:N-acetylglucosaminyldiphosphoundecaprenol N-acetyl-beta-D-mannosaminyltransferase
MRRSSTAPDLREEVASAAASWISLFGIAVDVDAPPAIVNRIINRAAARIPTKIYYANAHVFNLAIKDPSLRRSLSDADIVLADGYGVRLAARWLGLSEPPRAAITDCIWDFAAACARTGTSTYIVAGESAVAVRAAQVLRDRYPEIRILGTHHGYVGSPQATAEVVEDIRAKQPDTICVGMGTPAQERWIDDNFAELGSPVVFAVGAVMDFVSGEVARPRPPWMSDHGLEWVTRLIMEPRRMWRRYLFGHPRFLYHVLRARLAAHRRSA